MRINVWQVGYNTTSDFVLQNKDKAECKKVGWVEPRHVNHWKDDVWDLLNWSCWTDEKPAGVHSPLTHCNSDIILQREGCKSFWAAKPFGWKKCESLDVAINEIKTVSHSIWLFYDAKRVSGEYTTIEGKALWRKNDKSEWSEVTW